MSEVMNTPTGKIPPERLKAFLAVLQTRTSIDLNETFLDRLHRYVTLQLRGDVYQQHDPELAAWLDQDPGLAEAYALLYDLEAAVLAGNMSNPDHVPDPDLSFLTASPSLAERLAERVTRTGRELVLRFSEDLLALLRPGPQLAAGFRQADSGRYGILLYTLDGQSLGDPLPLTFNAYADREQPDFCLIEIEVALPDRSWPDLAGVVVELAQGDRLLQSETDAWGLAVFENVPIALLPETRIVLPLN